jgi:hypothetical protein
VSEVWADYADLLGPYPHTDSGPPPGERTPHGYLQTLSQLLASVGLE